MNRHLAFTRALHTFLIEEGYTHIRLMGVLTNHKFILVPLKEPIVNRFEDVDFTIEEIKSTEVIDMLYPMLGLDFYVYLPGELVTKYHQQ